MFRYHRLTGMITAVLFGAFAFFGLAATPAFAATSQVTTAQTMMALPPPPIPGHGPGNPGPGNPGPGNPGPGKPGPGNRCYPTIRQGARGPEVRTLQTDLRRLGYRDQHGHPLSVNGNFDNDTASAVRQFQRNHGIRPANGIVDASTWRALGECHQR